MVKYQDDGRVTADAATGLSQAEPASRLGPSGFDPSRWNDLCCAMANARYALEFWEREVRVAFQFLGTMGTEPPQMLVRCIERGREECATLREMEALVRPIAYPSGDQQETPNA